MIDVFIQDIPIVVVFKAYGIQSDQEIAELVGFEDDILNCFSASIEECHRLGIFTQIQVKYFDEFHWLDIFCSGIEIHFTENEKFVKTVCIESINASKSNR